MNSVVLIGRLTQDPELKYTQSGKAFCSFTLAVNREFKKDEADFIRCVAWEKTAEIIAQYLRKGNLFAVNGRLTIRKYEQDGQPRTITEVVVGSFQFLGSKNESSSYSSTASSNNSNSAETSKESSFEDVDNVFEDDDEFPF